MKNLQKTRRLKMVSMFAAMMLLISLIAPCFTIYAGESLPMAEEQARGANQPKFSGYRLWDIRDWSPETDPGAEFLRSEVPLQKRIDPLKATQANPELESDAEIMLMQGDYGNAFVDSMMYNNSFSYLTLNYWQYVDYFSPWHGAATADVPENLYDWENELTDPNGWQKRYFEFGIVNIPNPAYTNAAHRNGVKSIACIYFDQAFRQGQTINELFIQDESGKFIVAEKLIEMAKYFGYDGYFFNGEEAPTSRDTHKKFLATLEAAGLYTQFYDTNSGFNESKADYLDYELDGVSTRLQDSVFVNYGWTGGGFNMDTMMGLADSLNINPFERIFFGVEANQAKFSGSHSSARDISKIYAPGTTNPRASLALFTPSDFYQRALDDDLGGNTPDKNRRGNNDYQWMIMERERMYFSGVLQDPTDTGKKVGASNTAVGVSNASGWVGAADFTSERSVIGGNSFYTNFNTGRGLEYFNDGKVTNNSEWSNITIQSILPTWQWWVDTDAENKINVDFDFGTKYKKAQKDGSFADLGYTPVGAYSGGSSLVLYGDLENNNQLHLFKTDLAVSAESKVAVTYNKPSATDSSLLKLALVFKDDTASTEYIDIPNSGTKTNGWVKAGIDLSAYADREIAAISVEAQNNGLSIENYQINIGEVLVTDGQNHTPAEPTGFEIDRAFSTDEVIVKWDLGSFDVVDNYELFANLSDGTKLNLGAIYDDIYYVKSLLNEKNVASLELYAVGKDGSKSEAAVVSYDFSKAVSEIAVATKNSSNGNVLNVSKDAGVLDVSWKNPAVNHNFIKLEVSLENSLDKTVIEKILPAGTKNAQFTVPWANGERYTLKATTVGTGGEVLATINFTGKLEDVFIDSYDPDKVTIAGNQASFWSPDPSDWWKMYVSVDGVTCVFNSRFLGAQKNAIRGCTYLKSTLPKTSGTMKIVLEDYSGNLSNPTYITYGTPDLTAVDSTMFPDPALLAEVIKQASTTNLLVNITTLDLGGTDVKNLVGIDLLANLEKLSLKDCTEIELIPKETLVNNKTLKELDITNCSSLEAVSVNNTTLEKINWGEISGLPKLISIDMSSSRFDMSEGTSERLLADAINVNSVGKDDLVFSDAKLSNLALNAVPQSESTLATAEKLFNGSKTDLLRVDIAPSTVVLKFEYAIDVSKWELAAYGGDSYAAAGFEVAYSDDGVTWSTLGTAVTGNTSQIVQQEIDPVVSAKYFTLTITELAASRTYLSEFELLGYKKETYVAGAVYGNQKPVLYKNEVLKDVTVNTSKEVYDVRSILQMGTTVRETNFATLSSSDFVDIAYINEVVTTIDVSVRASIVDADGESFNQIDLSKTNNYVVDFVSFGTGEAGGKTLGTINFSVVNTSVLEKIVKSAEKLLSDGALENTIPAVIKEFEIALANAKAIISGEVFATQEDVLNASVDLVRAIGKVDWKAGDKSELEITLWLAGEIEPDLGSYVEAGIQAFKDTLSVARTVMADGNAVQDEIDVAADNLLDAILDLRLKVNKDRLKELVGKAKAVSYAAFTDSSVNTLKVALSDSEALLNSYTSTQKDVDGSADNLEKALYNLKEKVATTTEGSGTETKESVDEDITKATEKDKIVDTANTTGNTAPKTGETNMSFVFVILLGATLLSVVLIMKSKKSKE